MRAHTKTGHIPDIHQLMFVCWVILHQKLQTKTTQTYSFLDAAEVFVMDLQGFNQQLLLRRGPPDTFSTWLVLMQHLSTVFLSFFRWTGTYWPVWLVEVSGSDNSFSTVSWQEEQMVTTIVNDWLQTNHDTMTRSNWTQSRRNEPTKWKNEIYFYFRKVSCILHYSLTKK